MKPTTMASVIFLMASLLIAGTAAGEGWEVLGERSVGLTADRDTIAVTAAEGRFDAIKLEVRRNGIEFLDLKVLFGDGATHDVHLASFIKAGGSTRVIDLPGGNRVIKSVQMVYRSRANRRGHALVRLLGRHADTPAPAESVNEDLPGTWARLGSRTVNWRVDRDAIPVTASEGTFRKIKLQVHGNGIHIVDLEVVFGDGGSHHVNLASFIENGHSTRVIDLPGGARVIKRVEVVYQTRGARARKATVEVWGLH